MNDPRLDRLAQVLVNYSVGVKPGQLVRIAAPPAAMPLVSAIYRHVLAAGGQPFVRITPEELQELLAKHGNTRATPVL